MDLKQISNIIAKLHAGASYTVVYEKDGQLKKRPYRLGVRYGNMKHMVGLKPGPLPGNGKWIIDKYVYEDSKGYKLRVTNDAFGGPKDRPIVQAIKLENVRAIMKKGEEL